MPSLTRSGLTGPSRTTPFLMSILPPQTLPYQKMTSTTASYENTFILLAWSQCGQNCTLSRVVQNYYFFVVMIHFNMYIFHYIFSLSVDKKKWHRGPYPKIWLCFFWEYFQLFCMTVLRAKMYFLDKFSQKFFLSKYICYL